MEVLQPEWKTKDKRKTSQALQSTFTLQASTVQIQLLYMSNFSTISPKIWCHKKENSVERTSTTKHCIHQLGYAWYKQQTHVKYRIYYAQTDVTHTLMREKWHEATTKHSQNTQKSWKKSVSVSNNAAMMQTSIAKTTVSTASFQVTFLQEQEGHPPLNMKADNTWVGSLYADNTWVGSTCTFPNIHHSPQHTWGSISLGTNTTRYQHHQVSTSWGTEISICKNNK